MSPFQYMIIVLECSDCSIREYRCLIVTFQNNIMYVTSFLDGYSMHTHAFYICLCTQLSYVHNLLNYTNPFFVAEEWVL